MFQSGAELALVWGLLWQRPLRSWLGTHYNKDSCGFGLGSLSARTLRLWGRAGDPAPKDARHPHETTGGGGGGVPETAGWSSSWATGALGRPRCGLFSARCFPGWEGRPSRPAWRCPKAPWGLLRASHGGSSGPSVPQAAGFREQNGLQGGVSNVPAVQGALGTSLPWEWL